MVFSSGASNLVAGDTEGTGDIFLHDVVAGTTERLTPGDGASGGPAISADGQTVAFSSNSTTLDPSAPAGINIFVHDVRTGVTSALPLVPLGGSVQSFDPSLSNDGTKVAFMS